MDLHLSGFARLEVRGDGDVPPPERALSVAEVVQGERIGVIGVGAEFHASLEVVPRVTPTPRLETFRAAIGPSGAVVWGDGDGAGPRGVGGVVVRAGGHRILERASERAHVDGRGARVVGAREGRSGGVGRADDRRRQGADEGATTTDVDVGALAAEAAWHARSRGPTRTRSPSRGMTCRHARVDVVASARTPTQPSRTAPSCATSRERRHVVSAAHGVQKQYFPHPRPPRAQARAHAVRELARRARCMPTSAFAAFLPLAARAMGQGASRDGTGSSATASAKRPSSAATSLARVRGPLRARAHVRRPRAMDRGPRRRRRARALRGRRHPRRRVQRGRPRRGRLPDRQVARLRRRRRVRGGRLERRDPRGRQETRPRARRRQPTRSTRHSRGDRRRLRLRARDGPPVRTSRPAQDVRRRRRAPRPGRRRLRRRRRRRHGSARGRSRTPQTHERGTGGPQGVPEEVPKPRAGEEYPGEEYPGEEYPGEEYPEEYPGVIPRRRPQPQPQPRRSSLPRTTNASEPNVDHSRATSWRSSA